MLPDERDANKMALISIARDNGKSSLSALTAVGGGLVDRSIRV